MRKIDKKGSLAILRMVKANAPKELAREMPNFDIDGNELDERGNPTGNGSFDALQTIGGLLLSYEVQANGFVSTLINKVFMTIVDDLRFQNPISQLKQAFTLGSDVEEIISNPAIASEYDIDNGSGVLTITRPDTHAVYHRMNRQEKYKVSIAQDELELAFTSYEKFGSFITSLYNTLYNGDEIDEYSLMKKLVYNAVNGGYVKQTVIGDITDNETLSKKLVKSMKRDSAKMKGASSKYNLYKEIMEKNGKTVNPLVQWTPLDMQVILMSADTLAEVDVEVLAMAFNISKVEFLARVIEVDDFSELDVDGNILALLCDVRWFKVFDRKYQNTSWFNPETLVWQVYLHHWQTYSFSPLVNAMAYVKEEFIPPVTP